MLPLRIALRYLFSKKSHNAVNIISIISMAGVAVATAAIVCVLSVFNGFAKISAERQSAINPDILVLPATGTTIVDADSIAALLREMPQISAAIPTISGQALVIYANRQMPVALYGFKPEHSEIVDIASITVDGHYLPTDTLMHGAAISIGVAARLNAFPGSPYPLAIYAPRRVGKISAANPMAAFVSDSLTVSAVYESKDNKFDTQSIIVPYGVARHLFDYSTQASSIYVALSPGSDHKTVSIEIGKAVGPGFRVLTAEQQHESSFRMINIEKWVTFAMLAFILLIAGFNIISTLSMIIIEKWENMATLRALGATPATIRRIFTYEGWLITLVGGIGGILLGTGLVLAQQFGEFIKIDADPAALTITAYPVQLQLPDLLTVFALIAFVGFLIGYLASMLAKNR